MDEQEMFQHLWNRPMNDRGTMSIRSKEVELVGLQHGTVTITGVRHVKGLGIVLSLYEAGSSYWAARGQQKYAGAQTWTALVRHSIGTSWRYVQMSRKCDVKSSESARQEFHAVEADRLARMIATPDA